MLHVVIWNGKRDEIHYVEAENMATRQDADAAIRAAKAVDIATGSALMADMTYRIVDDAALAAYYGEAA